ncbi:DJ-1/PfpI family protein [Sphingomonas sp. AR_OL41]|uniref:DJ-1/PfpI family protein n=1 Tax=Sphingomonas sp. AR_OL41 TaxID=3042729 RepID=UPI0024814C08|nr:DJ-1/PfpI family protein [Sphingomonas sp. AR_OL41]MDH7974282.1 DJ-1/PfpI family protein [Sphingomonas sp. AR_OL41]
MTRIAFLLFPGLTQLDLTGPAQFLSRMPGAQMDLVWKDREPVPTDAGFAIVPTATFDEVAAADILCVPGGIGVSDVMEDDAAMAWVRRIGADAAWVTSVCTGSLILGAAGLLQGYRATTHWAWHHHLALFGAEPVQARTVVDRNRVTGGGVTAGIDFALTLIAAASGEGVARTLQLGLEYDPQPPFVGGTPDKAGAEIVAAYRAAVSGIMPQREAALVAAAARLGFPQAG